MKRFFLIYFFSLIFFLPLVAQSDAIKRANDFYAKGNYEAAAQEYEKILKEEGFSPELYYNLGNAYYKMNEIGKAILNYERALRLSPRFEDARFNLQIAQQKLVDNISESSTFFIQRWLTSLINFCTSNQWFIISFILFVVTLICAFIFFFKREVGVRKIALSCGIVFLILTIVCLTFSGIRKNEEVNHNQAIILSGVVTVKSAPDQSGTDLFQLHEGTKVTIKSSLGNWVEIKIANGSVGWLETKDMEVI
ncbi:MAG: tetratricopeptide repeat protein [Paludibacteraceae bacterium]|nr:tetratricopeptide repeat protein [Paludibacteraceae bacterium]